MGVRAALGDSINKIVGNGLASQVHYKDQYLNDTTLSGTLGCASL